jgi:probable rRNA maturation factor
VKISIHNLQRKVFISKGYFSKCIDLILKKEGLCVEEIAIYFVSKAKIADLHAQFFKDPTVTDCITFPIERIKNKKVGFWGEIFICPEEALEYAKSYHQAVKTEITLYLVHGILHLLGYDDIQPKDRHKMRLKEQELLTFLKKKGKSQVKGE